MATAYRRKKQVLDPLTECPGLSIPELDEDRRNIELGLRATTGDSAGLFPATDSLSESKKKQIKAVLVKKDLMGALYKRESELRRECGEVQTVCQHMRSGIEHYSAQLALLKSQRTLLEHEFTERKHKVLTKCKLFVDFESASRQSLLDFQRTLSETIESARLCMSDEEKWRKVCEYCQYLQGEVERQQSMNQLLFNIKLKAMPSANGNVRIADLIASDEPLQATASGSHLDASVSVPTAASSAAYSGLQSEKFSWEDLLELMRCARKFRDSHRASSIELHSLHTEKVEWRRKEARFTAEKSLLTAELASLKKQLLAAEQKHSEKQRQNTDSGRHRLDEEQLREAREWKRRAQQLSALTRRRNVQNVCILRVASKLNTSLEGSRRECVCLKRSLKELQTVLNSLKRDFECAVRETAADGMASILESRSKLEANAWTKSLEQKIQDMAVERCIWSRDAEAEKMAVVRRMTKLSASYEQLCVELTCALSESAALRKQLHKLKAVKHKIELLPAFDSKQQQLDTGTVVVSDKVKFEAKPTKQSLLLPSTAVGSERRPQVAVDMSARIAMPVMFGTHTAVADIRNQELEAMLKAKTVECQELDHRVTVLSDVVHQLAQTLTLANYQILNFQQQVFDEHNISDAKLGNSIERYQCLSHLDSYSSAASDAESVASEPRTRASPLRKESRKRKKCAVESSDIRRGDSGTQPPRAKRRATATRHPATGGSTRIRQLTAAQSPALQKPTAMATLSVVRGTTQTVAMPSTKGTIAGSTVPLSRRASAASRRALAQSLPTSPRRKEKGTKVLTASSARQRPAGDSRPRRSAGLTAAATSNSSSSARRMRKGKGKDLDLGEERRDQLIEAMEESLMELALSQTGAEDSEAEERERQAHFSGMMEYEESGRKYYTGIRCAQDRGSDREPILRGDCVCIQRKKLKDCFGRIRKIWKDERTDLLKFSAEVYVRPTDRALKWKKREVVLLEGSEKVFAVHRISRTVEIHHTAGRSLSERGRDQYFARYMYDPKTSTASRLSPKSP